MSYPQAKPDHAPMADEPPRPRLGRGLAALIGESRTEARAEPSRGQRRVPIEFVRPNPKNPRKNFAEPELDDLANSIREKGVIQPILVRSIRPDHYEIVAGERRWRAAQRAHLHDVPVIIIEADDKAALEIAIIENVQRTDLNALEEARGYEQLAAEFGYSHPDLAKVIGKSRSHVANTLRLLKLPNGVQKMLVEGQISAGHARALLTVADPDRVAQLIVAQGLTVRDVEKVAQHAAQQRAPETKSAAPKRAKDADTRALEQGLTDALGLIVTIEHKGESGEVRIRYKSLEQLDGLCQRLRR
jgi:ParB family chromosome partitioning protein